MNGRHRALRSTGYWLLAYSALWALFGGGGGWGFGVPSVLAAGACSHWLGLRPLPLRPRPLLRFLGFFLRHMVSGAWDVARRALAPRLPIAPAWADYRLRGADPQLALLLSAVVGLLPGTLVGQVNGRVMRVHVLDHRQDWQRTMHQLEDHLAALLGLERTA